MTNQDVICISSIDWDFIWQGHQEIMSSLAAQGCRVLFIENTGVRAPTWRDLPRLRQRLRNWWRSTRGFRKERENLFIYAPCLIPLPYSRIARWINRWWIMRELRHWMNVMGVDCPVVWTFLPTPLAIDIIRSLNPKLSVYYCIDNLAASSPAARRLTRYEQEMFRLVDTVFVTSAGLYQHAAAHAKDVHMFPFSVNFERFEAWRNNGVDKLPDDVAAIPEPRIGYVGGIHRWLDQDLLCRLAKTHPDWSFVFVGPVQTDVSRLAEHKNVHLLGSKPHETLPAYISSFNVALIPYELAPYTQCVYPTKMNEYFAMGKPIVSTPLNEVIAFNQRHGQCISIAPTAEAFSRSVIAELKESVAGVERRIQIAKENSWSHRIKQMRTLIDQRIAERERERTLHWQQLLANFLGQAQRRLLKLGAALLFVYLLLCKTPLIWTMAEPLKVSAPLQQADAIVVLGGGVGESGEAGQGYEERIQQAVQLYKAGYAPKLVLSSGFTRVFREAKVMRALAESLGVPPEAITLEESAANTYQNVTFVAVILHRLGAKSFLLVSSPYHMRRVSLVMARQAPELQMIPSPVERTSFYEHDTEATPRQIKGLLHEYFSIAYYWWRGWI